jgi:hypothetical protein
LAELLPEAMQHQVREGKVAAQSAMKFLLPVAAKAWRTASGWRRSSRSIIAIRGKLASCMGPSAKARTGAELLRDLEMVVAIVNRAHRRLAGAAATEVDQQQAKAALYQIERIQEQLLRIDEAIQPKKRPHVEPSTTHYDSRTECVASEQTRDRAGAENISRERAHLRANSASVPERSNIRRKPNVTGNRSWSFSTLARGTWCESMRNWRLAAQSCRMPR